MSLIRPCDLERKGGREGAPPPARRLVVHFWFSHAFWRRRIRRRKERNGIARFSAIGNKSQSQLPLFFSIYRSIGRSRLRIELDVFRASAVAAEHRLTRRAVSSSLSLSLSNADPSLVAPSLPPPLERGSRLTQAAGPRRTLNPCHVRQVAQSGDPRGVGEWGSGDGAEGGTELCRGVSSQKILRSRDQSSVDSEPASASLGILAFCFLALLNTADSVSLYSIIDFLRSIPSNSTLFLLRDTRFLTEPGMRTERRSENGDVSRERRVFWRTLARRVLESCPYQKRRWPRPYKKLGGRCQHMDGNATPGWEEGGGRKAQGGRLARATATKKSRRGPSTAAVARHALRAPANTHTRNFTCLRGGRSVPLNITVSKA